MAESRPAVGVVLGYGITLAALLLLNFALPRAMPGDPLSAMLADGSVGADPELQQELHRFYGLDEPLGVQLRDYLAGLATGDLGVSLGYRIPVADLLADHAPRSLLLVGTSLAVGTLIGIVAGAVAGWRRGGRWDTTALGVSAVLRGIPVFFLASVVCYVGAVRLGWFPLAGFTSRFTDLSPAARVADIAWHLVLPAAVLAVFHAAAIFLLMRAGMVGQLGAGYLMTVRATGVPDRIVRRHADRNALLPVAGRWSVEAGVAVTGAVLVEQVFAYDGLGSLLVDAIARRDYPLLQGCFLTLTCLVLTVGLLADLLARRLDPRTVERP